ncbi:bacterial lipocalin [Solitalea canadensis DSM 3403]|uniref:Bacterial lipocalin n=2 Tax=Solitalea canadensis TaxID=995 RepID=H8KXU2_SOLCM|nr:bacterial lipocalin [Solitalea canadensis DSM 3403]
MDGTVQSVNLEKFSGKWYSLSSIPTGFDNNWRETTQTYRINSKGYIDILTTYRRIKDRIQQSSTAKGFIVRGTNNAAWKIQFVWPFKSDYWIIELADDYSYAVVGHPKKKWLFILSRRPFLEPKLFQDIIRRCKDKGYNTDRLVSQDHEPENSQQRIDPTL